MSTTSPSKYNINALTAPHIAYAGRQGHNSRRGRSLPLALTLVESTIYLSIVDRSLGDLHMQKWLPSSSFSHSPNSTREDHDYFSVGRRVISSVYIIRPESSTTLMASTTPESSIASFAPSGNTWIIDSGASSHMTSNHALFSSLSTRGHHPQFSLLMIHLFIFLVLAWFHFTNYPS